MADLYQPVVWVDGQQLTAVNSANRWEGGIEALDNECDRLSDAVGALQAGGTGGGTFGQIPSGSSASRPSPAIGLLYYDTDLGKAILGTGSSWINVDGSAITGGGGGTSTAPQNMTATVTAGGTIGAINLSWGAVAGASSYKLYETESPTGVSGATALTTTSTTRTPGTARNYEYWVTATVGGVESAASNHALATLPFGGGGGGGSSDPSTFLNINGLGTGAGGWWNLGIGLGSHTDISPTQLQNSYVNSPYYTMNAATTAVQMQVFENGGTTPGSNYPRCEFREYQTGSTSTKASWSGSSGTHILRGATKLMHLAPNKPEIVIGQMHDSSDDTLQLRLEASSASGPYTLRLSVNGTKVKDLKTGIALGQEVAWDIQVANGSLTVKVDGTTQYGPTNPGYGSGQYFKAGCYIQQNTGNGNASTEYGRIELRNLFVSHA